MVAAGAAGAAAAGASALAGAAAVAGALPPLAAASTAFTSVPAGPIIANNESIGADSPSLIPIYNKVPA